MYLLQIEKGVIRMLQQYFVTYWNTKGQKVGMTIAAQSALDARIYAESLPEFKTLIQYPQAV